MNAPETTKMAAAGQPASGIDTVSGQLAEYAAGFSYDAIPEATRERAKYLILDAVGIALASTQYDFAHRIHSGIASMSEGGNSSLIGFSGRLPLRDAILFNAAMVHGLDYDDTHIRAIIHATASAFPCALGVSESVQASGKTLLAAYVLGLEIAIRISDAAGGKFHDQGFHPTGIAAHFSCALQAGWLYGLTPRQLVMAQGLMGSTAAGSQEFLEEGAWNKRMHPGWAGVAGLTAAHLARAGYKGPSKVYEGRFGLYRIYLGEHAASVRYDSIAETLGKVWEVHGIAIKPYPICHLIHACADAALLLREQHALASDDIERVVALVPKQSMHLISEPHDIKVRPANDYDAKFSTQYVVATCLVKGRFGLEELQESALKDAQVLALAAKVECIADPDSKYPEFFSGGVEIHMRDGRVLRHHEPVNRGAGERALSGEEIERKYFDNAVLAVNRSKAEAIRDAILEIEKYPATEFARLLSAAGAA
ncbi:MAG TPA: MmgE/PrpD family protein [Burkholderiales bacterium]|nr:MmgE/PrpD family protein [Burkholderiales bacterium]